MLAFSKKEPNLIVHGQGYQLEEYFYRTLSDSPQRVLRLKDANFFFLPYFSAALYDLCGHGGTGKVGVLCSSSLSRAVRLSKSFD